LQRYTLLTIPMPSSLNNAQDTVWFAPSLEFVVGSCARTRCSLLCLARRIM
jgi:hypothetical protein